MHTIRQEPNICFTLKFYDKNNMSYKKANTTCEYDADPILPAFSFLYAIVIQICPIHPISPSKININNYCRSKSKFLNMKQK